MVPLASSAACPICSPYISWVGSVRITRNTNCVGNVIRGPEPLTIFLLYLDSR